jgi:hypothetical protein
MKQITAKEFYALIEECPSIFKDWETITEITEPIFCESSPITHLSKYLLFTGRSPENKTAIFTNCPHLQIATGIFNGYVDFTGSNIKEIKKLEVLQPNNDGWAANFSECKNLKVASGIYAGAVSFFESGIESINDLHIPNPAKSGKYGTFLNCPNLKTLEGWDLSKKINIETQKLQTEIKRRSIWKNQPK